jgi:hypothetical protein
MPRRKRPLKTERSEHWLRVAVNECKHAFNSRLRDLFGWSKHERIDWISPIKSDDYAEYYDQAFLDKLGVKNLRVPLNEFWPRGGPRWDGLARTGSDNLILVEAKAYVEEAVDYRSKAGTDSLVMIERALSKAKAAFNVPDNANWSTPFYQYSNRLAHLYFLRRLNKLPAYLLFLYFADAPDVPNPCTLDQWQGALRLIEKCMGLGKHPFKEYMKTLIWSVPDMFSNQLVTELDV